MKTCENSWSPGHPEYIPGVPTARPQSSIASSVGPIVVILGHTVTYTFVVSNNLRDGESFRDNTYIFFSFNVILWAIFLFSCAM